jgi:hypothetical protein
LEPEQGGVYNPWHGFFLLPGHLGGSIERCSWIRSPMERFGLTMLPHSKYLCFSKGFKLVCFWPRNHPSPPPPSTLFGPNG